MLRTRGNGVASGRLVKCSWHPSLQHFAGLLVEFLSKCISYEEIIQVQGLDCKITKVPYAYE